MIGPVDLRQLAQLLDGPDEVVISRREARAIAEALRWSAQELEARDQAERARRWRDNP